MTKRVMVVDDQTIFREMLVEIISQQEGFAVVGEFSAGAPAIEACERLRPDLVILDVVLPDLSGVDVLRQLMARQRNLAVLLITAHQRPATVRDALQAGAFGFVTKGTPLRKLKEAIQQVSQGGTYFCPATAEMLRQNAISSPDNARLTTRERQIVQMVASGLSTRLIASQLGLSVKTVSNHRLNIRTKLGLRDVASFTRYAIDQGLIEPTV